MAACLRRHGCTPRRRGLLVFFGLDLIASAFGRAHLLKFLPGLTRASHPLAAEIAFFTIAIGDETRREVPILALHSGHVSFLACRYRGISGRMRLDGHDVTAAKEASASATERRATNCGDSRSSPSRHVPARP